jgi:hypothetical protein
MAFMIPFHRAIMFFGGVVVTMGVAREVAGFFPAAAELKVLQEGLFSNAGRNMARPAGLLMPMTSRGHICISLSDNWFGISQRTEMLFPNVVP